MTTRDPKTGRFPPRPQAPKGGTGWGGAAKGEGKKGGAPGSGRPLGVKNGEGKQAVRAGIFRELLAPKMPEMAQRWADIALDPNHPHHHTMILKAAEINGEFKQAVEVSGPDAGPVETKVTIEIVEPQHQGSTPV